MAKIHKGELEIENGLRIPRKTAAQIAAQPQSEGYITYNLDDEEIEIKRSGSWNKIAFSADVAAVAGDSVAKAGDSMQGILVMEEVNIELETNSVGPVESRIEFTTNGTGTGFLGEDALTSGIHLKSTNRDLTLTTGTADLVVSSANVSLTGSALTVNTTAAFTAEVTVPTPANAANPVTLAYFNNNSSNTIDDLSDTTITAIASGNALFWNGTAWVNRNIVKADVSDFVETDYVAVTGDVMTGFLTLSADPTADAHAATKKYVDDQMDTADELSELADVTITLAATGDFLRHNGTAWVDHVLVAADITDGGTVFATGAEGDLASSAVQRAGDTMTGALVLSGDPTLDTHATNKLWVENLVSAAAGAIELDELTDVDTTTTAVATGQALFFNGTQWVNRLAVKADVSDFTEAEYVHIAGTEIVTGYKTFNNDNFDVLLPTNNIKAIDIGSGLTRILQGNAGGAEGYVTLTSSGVQTIANDGASNTAAANVNSANGVTLNSDLDLIGISELELVGNTLTALVHDDGQLVADASKILLTGNAFDYSCLSGASTSFLVDGGNSLLELEIAGQALIDYSAATGSQLDFGVKATSPVTIDGDDADVLTTKQWVLDKVNAGGTALADYVTLATTQDITGAKTFINNAFQVQRADTNPAIAVSGFSTILNAPDNVARTSALQLSNDSTAYFYVSQNDNVATTKEDNFSNFYATSTNFILTGAGADATARAKSTHTFGSDEATFKIKGSGELTAEQMLLDINSDQFFLRKTKGGNLTAFAVDHAAAQFNVDVAGVSIFNYTAGVGSDQLDLGIKATSPVTVDGDEADVLTTKAWVLSKVGAAAGTTDLGDLQDVTIAGVATQHGIFWNGSAWVNRLIVEADISDFGSYANAVHTHVKSSITDFTETDYVHTTGAENIGGDKTFDNNVVITGDLTVNGTTTTVNTTELEITDSIIRLNKGETGAGATSPTQSGIEIERGTLVNSFLVWDETTDKFSTGLSATTGAGAPVDITTLRALATEEYVDATTYTNSFVIGDWTVGTPNTLVIAQSTHGVPISAVYHVTVVEAGDIVNIETSINATTGDVTLKTTGATFAGNIRISI